MLPCVAREHFYCFFLFPVRCPAAVFLNQRGYSAGCGGYNGRRCQHACRNCRECPFELHIQHCRNQRACPCSRSRKRNRDKKHQTPKFIFQDFVFLLVGFRFNLRYDICKPRVFALHPFKYLSYENNDTRDGKQIPRNCRRQDHRRI